MTLFFNFFIICIAFLTICAIIAIMEYLMSYYMQISLILFGEHFKH